MSLADSGGSGAAPRSWSTTFPPSPDRETRRNSPLTSTMTSNKHRWAWTGTSSTICDGPGPVTVASGARTSTRCARARRSPLSHRRRYTPPKPSEQASTNSSTYSARRGRTSRSSQGGSSMRGSTPQHQMRTPTRRSDPMAENPDRFARPHTQRQNGLPVMIELKSAAPPNAIAGDNLVLRETVSKIISDVREHGDIAVRSCSEQFDGWSPSSFRLGQDDVARIIAGVDAQVINDIGQVQRNVRDFAERQRDTMLDLEVETMPGVFLGVGHRSAGPRRRSGTAEGCRRGRGWPRRVRRGQKRCRPRRERLGVPRSARGPRPARRSARASGRRGPRRTMHEQLPDPVGRGSGTIHADATVEREALSQRQRCPGDVVVELAVEALQHLFVRQSAHRRHLRAVLPGEVRHMGA